MKIKNIALYEYSLTYRFGTYAMSGGRTADSQSSSVVAITTDTGITGWGESASLAGTYLPAFGSGIRAAISEMAPALIGQDPCNIRRANQIMDGILLDQRAAKSPIDIALWDILGKANNASISTLTGGIIAEKLPMFEAVPLKSPEIMVQFVNERMAEGIKRFQVKVGNEPELDAARAKAVYDAVPSDVVIVADSNGGWDLHDALKAVKLMEDLPIYIEQPCRRLEDNFIVARHMTQQLSLDESIVTIEDLYRAKENADISAINLKFARVGGFSKAMLIRDTAEAIGIKVGMEDTWGGDIASAAINQLASTSQQSKIFNVTYFNDWTLEHVAGYKPRSVNGFGEPLTGPGLGIEVDASQLNLVKKFE